MNTELLLRTAIFAASKHRNQRRKNKEKNPYIIHPLRVAHYISSVGKVNDLAILQAALLHDTVEDVEVTYEELVREFGEEVANIVKEVTDDKSLTKVRRKQLQIEKAPHKSYGAKLVKLADKLDNTTDLLTKIPEGWKPEIVHGYFVWTYLVVQGLRGTNAALEAELDKIFVKVIKPDEDLEASLAKYYEVLVSNK
ncbi:5-bis(diphosphate) 3-pyrophosphohydrolase MESH1 [uncultured virus]|nr:5-bis(diphosphate) 3-pyrophosphohydrolase MESH1 [uncultured virus]